MAMYIGGNLIADGSPIRMNGAQPDKIMRGATQVWVNNYAPSAITDFVASDDNVDGIICTWSVANAVPAATYDLYLDGVLRLSNVTSGVLDVVGSIGSTFTYHVVAVNSVGSTASNTDTGIRIPPPYAGPPSPVIINSTVALVAGTNFPADTVLTICMVGGGGGGGGLDTLISLNNGGGYAGQALTTTISFLQGEPVTATIGGGGAGGNTTDGIPGASTSLGPIVAVGGAGGLVSTGAFAGNGETVTTCGGTNVNGIATAVFGTAFGGQSSGFGKGGSSYFDLPGEPGGIGSGGGAIYTPTVGSGGAGGAGQINISW